MVQTMLIQFYCTIVSSGSALQWRETIANRTFNIAYCTSDIVLCITKTRHLILQIRRQILNALQKSRPSYVWGVAFLKPTISIVATPPQWEKWDIDIKCDPITHTMACDAALDVKYCRGPIIYTALGLICRNLHLGSWTICETENWHDLIIFWNWQLTSAI